MIDIDCNATYYTFDELLELKLSDKEFGSFNLSVYQTLLSANKSNEQIFRFIAHLERGSGITYDNKDRPFTLIGKLKDLFEHDQYTKQDAYFFFTFLSQLLGKIEQAKHWLDKVPQIETCCALLENEAKKLSEQIDKQEADQLPAKPLENKEDKKARSLPTTDQAIYFLFHLFQHRGIVLDKDEQAAIIAFLQGKSLESTRQRLSTLFTDKNKSRKLVENDLQVVTEMFQQMNAPDLVDLITREKK